MLELVTHGRRVVTEMNVSHESKSKQYVKKKDVETKKGVNELSSDTLYIKSKCKEGGLKGGLSKVFYVEVSVHAHKKKMQKSSRQMKLHT